MALLPPCPTCRVPLLGSRLLKLYPTEVGVGPGTDATLPAWLATVSCPGCLAVVEMNGWQEGGPEWSAREVTSSSAVTRIRDRLELARKDQVLQREVRALFSNPASALLLGTPELLEFVREGLGRTVTVREDCGAWIDPTCSFSAGDGFPPGCSLLASIGWKSLPAAPGNFAVHTGQALTVTGVRDGKLLCEFESQPVLVALSYLEASSP